MLDVTGVPSNIQTNGIPAQSKYLTCSPLLAKKNDSFESTQTQNQSAPVQNTAQPPLPQDTQASKKKKTMIATVALSAAALITVLGVVTKANGLDKKVAGMIREAMEKDNGKAFNFTEIKETLKVAGEDRRVLSLANFSNNMANIKDCYIVPILKKIPGLKQFVAKTSDIYKKAGVQTAQSAYKRANNAYGALDTKILELIPDGVREDISKLIKDRNEIIKSNFTPECISKIADTSGIEEGRIAKIEEIMDTVGDGQKGICVAVRDKFTSIITQGVKSKGESFKKFGNFVAEDILADKKRGYISKLETAYNEVAQLDDEIMKKLKDCNIEDADDAMKKAHESLERAIRVEGNDLFDKMRDIKIGSAPTDILGMAGTTGLMGIYLAQADNKDQRVEVALTTGVPLGLGMLATTFATIKMYSGVKALGFGVVATFVSNIIGKVINNEYQKRNNVESTTPNIPTLDGTISDINQQVKDKIKI